jgi:hypothetical protein
MRFCGINCASRESGIAGTKRQYRSADFFLQDLSEVQGESILLEP